MKFLNGKKASLLGALALLMSVMVQGKDTEEAEGVKEGAPAMLTKDTFDEFLKEHDVALVKFYAPWCGHCKRMAPSYEAASIELHKKYADKELSKKIGLAKVDCTKNEKLCSEYDVGGYPTLKVYKGEVGKKDIKKDDFKDYKGGRDQAEIVKYMIKQTEPLVKEVSSKDLKAFKEAKESVSILGLVKRDSAEYNELVKVADQLGEDHVFGYSEDEEIAKKLGHEVPSVIVFRSFEDAAIFEGKISSADLKKFVQRSAIQVFGEIGPENYKLYETPKLPLGFLFYDSEKGRKKIVAKLVDVAKKYRDNFHFVCVNGTKFAGLMTALGLEQKFPAFSIQDQDTQKKWVLSQEKDLAVKGFESFVKGVIDGSVKAHIKSQPVPETNDEPVKVVVADSFSELVFDKTKDVLIEFYATWCYHCKQLAPTYTKLAELLAKQKDLVIAKMDATENDIPEKDEEFGVKGFPTIVLVKAKSNEIVKYESGRQLEDFVKFLKENTDSALKDAGKLDLEKAKEDEEKKAKEEKKQKPAEKGEEEEEEEEEKQARDEL
ncbi:Protein disulfide-isomerase [Zancudomyces culisetae]|uniref:Protein disulfide-isomerase n=1 Tax=Zancudomyces culisetae TaxID=1213189 RepID=A0A1R1PYN9_ZANCU|nr:Protein disulfide-isomerase [Zancudomyces culisetae]|eukprot:OMH86078.1 Protein disulfide-isomerase [Zancudomyces culisetae]